MSDKNKSQSLLRWLDSNKTWHLYIIGLVMLIFASAFWLISPFINKRPGGIVFRFVLVTSLILACFFTSETVFALRFGLLVTIFLYVGLTVLVIYVQLLIVLTLTSTLGLAANLMNLFVEKSTIDRLFPASHMIWRVDFVEKEDFNVLTFVGKLHFFSLVTLQIAMLICFVFLYGHLFGYSAQDIVDELTLAICYASHALSTILTRGREPSFSCG